MTAPTLDGLTAELTQAHAEIASLRKANAKLYAETTHDALTGLLNRKGLAERWQGRDIDQHDALAVLDLDNFKQVNDTYGHAAGDRVLRHVARDLDDRYHVVARLSGDELAIVDGRGRLGDLVRCPLAWQVPLSAAFTLTVTASVGIAKCTAPLNLVQARADAALYDAKAERGSACWFELRRHPHLRTAEGIEARPARRLRDTRTGVAR
ncbi:GGDEF domain-containing protein [Micromonospora sp. NBRC 101691]|uniref:GGDEF domain-containing protein n=1 Tax=Micromonospora sp. NBRC 101691 TaxID=3032198 RepID=UPI0024A1D249|nr:GGDEF domain-containing protein [Micromonospora sp. NBRC 101691]GLY21659.1 hypothetical protein Misp04_13910 [Micromonospora sp. NBRC 101691]